MKVERRRPVLLIQHAPHEHPAILRRALESLGIQTLWIHPYRGDAYPSVTDIRGVISLGGPMGANDDADHPWIPREVDLLRQSILNELPTLGICLGGQMMARAMGARVTRNRVAEVGWFPISIKPEGRKDRLLGSAGGKPVVYHWHQDTFEIPPEAVHLAESAACERQAYRIGEHAWGVQFHPEADHQLVHEWLAHEDTQREIHEARERHGSRTVQDAETQRTRAVQGERASLKIATSIAQLFSPHAFSAPTPALKAVLGRTDASGARLIVELEGSDRRSFLIEGEVAMRFRTDEGEFLMLRDGDGLLWPVRSDRVLSVEIKKTAKNG
jgi:GMP synthase (glutamine-hydrolysing)